MNPNLLNALQTMIWAMEPVVLHQMADIVVAHSLGHRNDQGHINLIVEQRDLRHSAIAAIPGQSDAPQKLFSQINSVAWIPVGGVLHKLSSQVGGASQPRGTSYEAIRRQGRAALADPSVKSILLHIDSPGGAVDGMLSLSQEIQAWDAQKPVFAFYDGMAASAGVGLGVGARRIIAANTDTLTGSVGTFMVLVDSSGQAEKAGLKVHLLKSGGKESVKGAGTAGAQIPQAAIDQWQAIVDSHAAGFQAYVKARRNLTSEQAAKVSNAGVFQAVEAKALGLIDNVDSVENVISYMDQSFGKNK